MRHFLRFCRAPRENGSTGAQQTSHFALFRDLKSLKSQRVALGIRFASLTTTSSKRGRYVDGTEGYHTIGDNAESHFFWGHCMCRRRCCIDGDVWPSLLLMGKEGSQSLLMPAVQDGIDEG